MFEAMHEELKGYKDAFLLESVHKPIIANLISLYDDLETIHRQVQGAVEYAGSCFGSAANLVRASQSDGHEHHAPLRVHRRGARRLELDAAALAHKAGQTHATRPWLSPADHRRRWATLCEA